MIAWRVGVTDKVRRLSARESSLYVQKKNVSYSIDGLCIKRTDLV